MTVRAQNRLLAGVGLSLCLLLLVPSLLADSRARIVRLSYVNGDVQIDRADGSGFERAFLNLPLVEGGRVWTRADSMAEVELENGSTIRLAPESVLLFPELRLRDSGQKYTRVEMQEGLAYFDLRKDGELWLSFGPNQLVVDDKTRFRVRMDRATTELAVFKGKLEVLTPEGEVEVRKNETLTLYGDDPGRYYLARGIQEDSWDAWDRERDDYRNTYLARSTYSGYSSGYVYGVSDLHYYGSYFYAPGYGQVWRPYGVGFGWDPFLDGAWVWYPRFGYIFVSAHPWGWTPYRYGGWVWIGGSGWCWRPSRHWGSWYTVPVVHRGPRPGRHVPIAPPRPPRDRRGGTVFVGSGPRFNPDDRLRRGFDEEGRRRPGRIDRAGSDAFPGGVRVTPPSASPTQPAPGTVASEPRAPRARPSDAGERALPTRRSFGPRSDAEDSGRTRPDVGRAQPLPSTSPEAGPGRRTEPRNVPGPRAEPRSDAPRMEPRNDSSPRVGPRSEPPGRMEPRSEPSPRMSPRSEPPARVEPRSQPAPRMEPRSAPPPSRPSAAPVERPSHSFRSGGGAGMSSAARPAGGGGGRSGAASSGPRSGGGRPARPPRS